MAAYYNEIEPYAAQWLRNLIAEGHIAAGDVDERSIVDVQPDDLRGYDQCHFFAGIGGWSYALRLAGWPDDRPVWTGSCPCQPFSAAGKQRGSDDERHLWPAFFRLIRECRPATVFGEQVAGAAGYAWFDHVAADLEGEVYAAAACDIGAHSVGALHIRQRLYWVANTNEDVGTRSTGASFIQRLPLVQTEWEKASDRSSIGRALCVRCGSFFSRYRCNAPDECDCPRCQGYCGCRMADNAQVGRRQGRADDAGRGTREGTQGRRGTGFADDSNPGVVGNADHQRLEGRRDDSGEHAGQCAAGSASPWMLGDATSGGREVAHQFSRGCATESEQRQAGFDRGASALDAWSEVEWIRCSDGKARATQSGIFPLVDGLPGGGVAVGRAAAYAPPEVAGHIFSRVGVLRGAGNAIVPQVAAAFIRAAA